MLTQEASGKIVDMAIHHAGKSVEGIEVHLVGTDIETSRFANNEMTQHQANLIDRLAVRVLSDGRQIRLETDDLSSAGVCKVVDQAISAVKLMEKDQCLLPLVNADGDGEWSSYPDRFEAGVLSITAAERAAAIGDMIAIANEHELNAAGVYASGTIFEALGNSKGLFSYHRETHVESSVTMCGPDSTGWAKAQGPHAKQVNTRELARSAAMKARASSQPEAVKPGRYTVILEHSAFLDLLSYLWWDFTGTSHLDKRSSLLDKIGDKVFGDNITIEDDVYHHEQAGCPFDGEGLARRKVTIVEDGILRNLVYGRRSASRMGVAPTGHGLPEPNSLGDNPMNLVIVGDGSSVDDMVKSTEKGILLTRVWYVRQVDPARKIVTGMTRDGTFLVENGEVSRGIKNLRFNVSLIELLNNVVAVGQARRTAGEEGVPQVVPAMKIADFNFTEVTRF
ncbi:MAG: TldD/PmbA family protein [Candidatus Obscuribacterales bacterium]|nr:TldD/PmbA family protein [Candidatus Obscuribacterales bacterium]